MQVRAMGKENRAQNLRRIMLFGYCLVNPQSFRNRCIRNRCIRNRCNRKNGDRAHASPWNQKKRRFRP
jgi:hypothetical protein